MSAVTREHVGGAVLAVVGAVAFVVYVLSLPVRTVESRRSA